MQPRRFAQLDVFAHHALQGNALAVVLDGEGIGDAAMLDFARWTNLSETTFVLPPTPEGAAGGADYRLRIFTPAGELAFAGHPTLGSCQAWLNAGGTPRQAQVVVQECAKGLVSIQRSSSASGMDHAGLAFAAPPLQRSEVPAGLQAQVLAALALQADDLVAAQWLDNGSRWMGLLMRSTDMLPRAQPNAAALRTLGVKAGLCAIHTPSSGAMAAEPVLEVRGITLTAHGIAEDPATGSLNASLAQWLGAAGHIALPYRVQQGAAIGRAGRMRLVADAQGQIWVQGQVHSVLTGQVVL
ncbi:PhzF family phenazine biosynthesis protein [Comamonas sp.]|uniref:PhzF family phenazine biosynthesis protein n=1 Tax=Comamonas sp. TaxID=34028 RepID=UPI002898C806|nr:PhzF family phenazine biosynthesis protein [Comamonas sp.]